MEKRNRRLSPQAQEVFSQLNWKVRKEIQKGNPFKGNRNRRIRELKAKGVRWDILAEITGLHRATIYRIVKDTHMTEYQIQEIQKLTTAFEALLRTLNRLLTNMARRQDEGKH